MSTRIRRTLLNRPFASHAPITKLIFWLLGVGLTALGVQVTIDLLGIPFNVFSHRGSWVYLLLGLAGLVWMMASEQRSMAAYGLVMDERWWKSLMTGFLVGTMTYAAYYVIAIALGAMALAAPISKKAIVSASFEGLIGFVLAIATHVIFCGYLLSIIRERHGRVVGVLTMAGLFAFLGNPQNPLTMIGQENWRLFVGLLAVMSLLGIMRLWYGDILRGSGLLAGWIFIERLVSRAHLVTSPSAGNEPQTLWLCPQMDPRQGWFMWLLLAAAVSVYAYLLQRRGEPKIEPNLKIIPDNLKRIYPLAQPNMFAPLDVWLSALWRARFRIGAAYGLRLACTLTFSALNTLISLPERLLLPILVCAKRVPDPIFIVGLHRSGTTHLHNLLALDRSLIAPRLHQVLNPAGFVVSGWLLVPFMALGPPQRPMDNMRLHAFTPNEEEWAVTNITGESPYWGLAFPRQGVHYDRYFFPHNFSQRESKRWKRHYHGFLQRLCFLSRRRPVLKNPINTGRVAVLRRMYPKAKFIHIRRHPYAVYRSNLHMAEQGHILMQLQDPDCRTAYGQRFPRIHRKIEQAYYRDAADLPEEQVAEIRFEDLERDPLGEIEMVYRKLGLRFSAGFRHRLDKYIRSLTGYRKNVFKPLESAEIEQVYPQIEALLELGGYAPIDYNPAGMGDG